MPNPHPPTKHLQRGGSPGRPKGSKNKLTRERVERELRHIAFSNIIDAFENVHGNRKKFTLRELKAMPDHFQRCISSVKVKTENLTVGDDSQDIVVEIKLWSKDKALELCARSLGMLRDHVIIEGLDDRKARLRAALTRRDDVE